MPPYPYDHQFKRLMDEAESGGPVEEHMAELLRLGHVIHGPLQDYLTSLGHLASAAVLLDLLAKSMGLKAAPLLLKYLDSREPGLRRAAANALGWVRARVALPILDRMEAEDPDAAVRAESRAAIEEILREWPGLAGTLQNHEPMTGPITDEGAERVALVLPRLLAVKYRAAPLGMSSDQKLRVAVRIGGETRLLGPLEAITGRPVALEPRSDQAVSQLIEKMYHQGDDDFIQAALELRRQRDGRTTNDPPSDEFLHPSLFGSITPSAREELIEAILAGIRLDEPACPFEEASDVVEGLQAILAEAAQVRMDRVILSPHQGHLLVLSERDSGAVRTREVGDPETVARAFALVHFLLGDEPEEDPVKGHRRVVLTAGSSESRLNLAIELQHSLGHSPRAILRPCPL